MIEILQEIPDLYKALGAAGSLALLLILAVIWYIRHNEKLRREEKADKMRIIEALAACHTQREESLKNAKAETVRLVQALERNSVAFGANTASNKSLESACVQIVASLRDRPCFDITPPHAHRTPLPRIGGQNASQ